MDNEQQKGNFEFVFLLLGQIFWMDYFFFIFFKIYVIFLLWAEHYVIDKIVILFYFLTREMYKKAQIFHRLRVYS